MSEVDDAVRAFIGERRQASTAAFTALDDNPDEAARAQQLSLETGVPASVIHGDLENFERSYKGDLNHQIISRSPILQDYINSSPMAAKVSHDDFHNLDAASEVIKNIAGAGAKGFETGFDAQGFLSEWQKFREYIDHPLWKEFAKTVEPLAVAPALGTRLFSGIITGGAASAGEAFYQMSGSRAWADRLTRDLYGLAQVSMAGQAGFHLPGEFNVPAKMAKAAERLNEGVRAAEPWIENKQTPPRGVHPVFDEAWEEASKEDIRQLDEALSEASKSATRERSPELFSSFVRQIVGNGKIEISAEAVRKIYGEDIPTADDGKLGWIPNLREQLEATEPIGGSVEAPLADWLARVDPELAKELREEIRVRPQGLTLREIEEGKERSEAEAKRREEALEPEAEPPPKDEVEAVRRQGGMEEPLFAEGGWRAIEAGKEETDRFRPLLPESADLGGTVIHGDPVITVPRIVGMKLKEILDKIDFSSMDEGTRLLNEFFGKRLRETVGETPVHVVSDADMAKLLAEKKLDRIPPGYYSPAHDHIVLTQAMVDGTWPPEYASRVIIHEAEHALSSGSLLKYPVLDAAMRGLMRDADEFLQSRDTKARKAFDYAFKNSREFMAEVKSRPALQKWLATAPVSKESAKVIQQIADAIGFKERVYSVWDAIKIVFKDLYRNIFGKVPDNSILDQIFKMADILEQTNKTLEAMAEAKGISKGDLLQMAPTEFAEGEKPMFGKMAIGMNKRWQEKYFKLIEKRNQEDMEREFRVAEKEERQRQTAQWKEDYAKIHAEVQNDLQGRPDIAVGTFFNEGRIHGVKVNLAPKLDAAKLSEEQKAVLPKSTYGRGGIDPDDLAGAFGLRSGDEVVQVLAQIQQAKGEAPFREYVKQVTDREVTRRMRGRFGDLEENIMNEAIEHVLGNTQMDILHEEMVGLGMQLGRELPFTKEDTKSFAKAQFDKTPVGQVTVEKMLRDAGKAGTDAELALLDNKPADAFKSKQQQYLSLRMAVEARKFEKDRRAFERIAKQFSRREVSSVLPEYTNYVHQILGQVGYQVRRSVQDLQAAIAQDGYGTLEQFVQAKENALREMPVADFLFDPAFRKPLDQLTVGEARAVMNSVKTLVHNGRDEMKIIREGEARDLEEVLTEMKEKLESLGKDKTPRVDRPISPNIRRIKTAFASSITNESLLNRFDRDDPRGIFHRFIIYPLAEAANHEAGLIRDSQKRLREAVGDIKDIDKLVDNDLFIDPLNNQPMIMRKRNVLAILQNVGNKSNLEKLTKGYNLRPEQVIQWVLERTDKADWDRAQRIGDVFAKLSELADEMGYGLSGVTFEKIPLDSIQTPFGLYRGWYNPIKYDPNRPGRSKRLIGPNALEEEGYFRATTPQGYTKGRTGYIAPLELDFDVIPMRMKQMIHDISFRPAVVQASKVYYDSSFQRAVIKNYGEVHAKQLVPYLKDVANFSNSMSDASAVAGQTIEWFRQNMIATLIGFNSHTVAKHGMTAAINSMTEVGPINFLKAMSDLLRNSDEAGKSNWRFAMEHSEELQRRLRNWSELIQGQPEISLMRSSVRDFIIAAGSTPVAVGDLLSAVPTWLARYRSVMEEGLDHGQAVAEANRAVRRAHGSSVITNRSQIQRAGGLAATFTSLYGFFSHMLQKQFELAWKAADSFEGLKKGDLTEAKKHTPTLLMGFMSYVILPALVEELVTPYTNHEKDSWGVKAAKTLALGMSSSWIGIRDLVHATVNWREPQAGLIGTFMKAPFDIARDLSKGTKIMNKEEAGRVIRHTFTLVGAMTGLTNAQMGRTAEFIYRYNHGLERPKGPWDWMSGLTRGTLKEYRR